VAQRVVELCYVLYTAGLFLHVGYSVKDQHLIEANTPVSFRADSVADKLGTLLNEDSAEQVCPLANDNEHNAFEKAKDRRFECNMGNRLVRGDAIGYWGLGWLSPFWVWPPILPFDPI